MSANLLFLSSKRGGRQRNSGRQTTTPLLVVPDPSNDYSALGIDLYLPFQAVTPANLSAAIFEENDSLTAIMTIGAGATSANLDTALIEENDTLAADMTAPIMMTGLLFEADDILTASLSLPINMDGAVIEADDTLSSAMGFPAALAGALVEEDDALTATVIASVVKSASLVEEPDTLVSSMSAPFQFYGNIIEANDTLVSALAFPAALNGPLVEANDTLDASLSAPIRLSADLVEENDWIAGLLNVVEGVPSQAGVGDVHRRKKPVVYRKLKIERELEEVLELVEDIEPQNRTSVKRAAVKQAREAFRSIEIPADYSDASQAISEALAKVSRAAGEYAEFQAAAMRAAMEIEALIAEMDRRRKKRRQEEEILVQWVLS